MHRECICTNPVHGGKIWKCGTDECTRDKIEPPEGWREYSLNFDME